METIYIISVFDRNIQLNVMCFKTMRNVDMLIYVDAFIKNIF